MKAVIFAWWEFRCYFVPFQKYGYAAFVDINIDLMCKVPTSVIRSSISPNGINTKQQIYPKPLNLYEVVDIVMNQSLIFCSKLASHALLCTLLFIQNTFHVDLICHRAGRTCSNYDKHNYQSKRHNLMLTFQMFKEKFHFRLCNRLAIDSVG